MKIRRVTIQNFASCETVDFVCNQFNILVGPNNTGKTNILRALDFALNPDFTRRRDPLTIYSYWKGQATTGTSVTITFEELTQEDIDVFAGDNLEPGDNTGKIIEGGDSAAVLDQNPLYLRITTKAAYDEEADEHPVITFFTKFGEQATVTRQQKRHVGFFYLQEDQAASALLGLGPNSLLRRIIKEGDESLSEQATALLAQLATADATLNSNALFDATTKSIAGRLAKLIPFASANPPDLEYVLAPWAREGILRILTPAFQVAQSPMPLPLGLHGRGTNAAAVIAAALAYREAHQGSFILAIEEPETALHPQLQRALMQSLRDSAVQVFATTHSPIVASQFGISAIQLVRKRSESTVVSPAELPNNEPLNKFVDRYLREKFSEALFADVILLVEGDTDEVVLSDGNGTLAAAGESNAWGLAGVSIVPVDNVTRIPEFAKHFRQLGIRTIAVFDNDPAHQNVPLKQIQKECNASVQWPADQYLYDIEGAIFADAEFSPLFSGLAQLVTETAELRFVSSFVAALRIIDQDLFTEAREVTKKDHSLKSLSKWVDDCATRGKAQNQVCRSALKVAFKQSLSSPRYLRGLLKAFSAKTLPPRLKRMLLKLNGLILDKEASYHGILDA